ncbi:MAG: hypothetical protein ACRDBX_03910, partial [Erysipelotrichaceae bacterium]
IVVLRKQIHPQIKYLLWLPLVTLLADVSQQVLLRLYLQEAELAFLSKWIPLFTQWKWVCIYGTFSVLIVAFGYKFIAFQKAKLFGETM